MGGKRMPQRVWTGTGWESGPLAMFFDEQLYATRAETTATVVQEELAFTLSLLRPCAASR